MAFDFDTLIDRHDTHSLKWDNPNNTEGLDDILPLWVADMDFAVLPEVQAALQRRVSHPVFGYMRFPPDYVALVIAWHRRRYDRQIAPQVILPVPSVMHALSMAVRTFSQPGERILVQPPVYYPFFRVASLNDREIIESPLAEPHGPAEHWNFDFSSTRDVLKACQNEGKPVKVWLFCSPQNPTGRVWNQQELTEVARLATEFDLVVLADEIHADLVNPAIKFVSALDVPELATQSLIFAGPNKTFNLAGLSLAHVFVQNESLRQRFRKTVEADFFNEPNVLSIEAAMAAYQHGDAWLDEVLKYIGANHAHLTERLTRWKLRVEVCPWEGTYLAWVNIKEILIAKAYNSESQMIERWEKQARVKLTAGNIYGSTGRGWIRINLACPRHVLQTALERVETFEGLV